MLPAECMIAEAPKDDSPGGMGGIGGMDMQCQRLVCAELVVIHAKAQIADKMKPAECELCGFFIFSSIAVALWRTHSYMNACAFSSNLSPSTTAKNPAISGAE
jgi:hypothetical protein